jgi:hypothetical protein
VRDNFDDTLGGFAGTANSAAVNRVRAAHSSKAALAASSRSKDRSDRATGAVPGGRERSTHEDGAGLLSRLFDGCVARALLPTAPFMPSVELLTNTTTIGK